MSILGKRGTSGGSLGPLTRPRIEQGLKQWNATYTTDGDGDFVVLRGTHLLFVMAIGSKKCNLMIRGAWASTLASSHRAQAFEAINTWHQDKIWPKAFVQEMDDGRFRIDCEVAVDLEVGVTDQQLSNFIVSALVVIKQFYDELADSFPQARSIAGM